MQASLEAVQTALAGFRQATHLQFTSTLKEADDAAGRALSLGLVIGALVVVLIVSSTLFVESAITRNINNVVASIKEMASGNADLTQRLPAVGNDEVGELVASFNRLVEKLQGIMRQVKDASVHLAASANEMSAITEDVSRSVAKQQSETAQVATAVTEMATTVDEVANYAARASAVANNANDNSAEGRMVVRQTVTAMESLAREVEAVAEVIHNLESESDRIGGVLDVIRGISEQTNLLALNAAIEAARAGDQGRGFAVVADEVRTLASRTHGSTQEIQTMIEQLQKGADAAVKAMEDGQRQAQASVEQAAQADTVLETIAANIIEIREMNTQIASATEEQNAVAQEIDRNVSNISQLAEDTGQGTRKNAQASETLVKLAEHLQSFVGKYKV